MKKKIGLMALLAVSASALSLTSCSDNKQTQANSSKINDMQGNINDLDTEISTVDSTLSKKIDDEISKLRAEMEKADTTIDSNVVQAIATIRTEMETADATTATNATNALTEVKNQLQALIDAHKTTLDTHGEDIEDLKAQDTTLDGKITAAKTALEAVDASMQETLDTINAAIEALQSTDSTLDTKIDGINTSLTDAIASLESRIKQAAVTQADLDEAVAALEAVDGTLSSDIEDLEADITTINGSITTINGTLTSYGTRITTLETSVGILQNNATTVDDKIAAINTAITELQGADVTLAQNLAALELAAATKTELANQVTALNAVDTELRGLITTLRGQFDQAVIAFQNKDTAHEADIDAINEELEAINDTLDEYAENIQEILDNLGESSAGFIKLFDDFYGAEATDIKTGYIYDLSQTYVKFKNTLDNTKEELIEKFKVNGEISPENSEFINSLYRRLYNTSDTVMFGYLWKGASAINLAANIEDAEAAFNEYNDKLESFINEASFNIVKETNRQAVDALSALPAETEEEILSWINVVEYNTEETLAMTAEQVQEYYQIRIDKVSLYGTWGQAIDNIYKKKAVADTTIIGYLKEEAEDISGISEAEKETLLGMVNDTFSIESYYEIGAEIHAATDTLSDVTFDEAKAAIQELYKADVAEINLILAQAGAYYDVTVLDYENYTDVHELENITQEEREYFEGIINAYHDMTRYTELESEDDVDDLYEDDEFAMNIYGVQATSYDEVRRYEKSKENQILIDLQNIKEDEVTSINNELKALADFNVYKVLVDAEEGAFEDKEEVLSRMADDKASIDILEKQAYAYDAARGTDIENEAIITALTAITADEKTAIKTKMAETPLYVDYINGEATTTETAITAKRNADQAYIILVKNQAVAYDEARAYDVTKEATVTAFENIIATEKTTINELLAAIPTYDGYIDALENTTAISTKLTSDKNAIDFVIYKATKYDNINGTVKEATAAINDLAAITADEKTAFNDLITAIPTYAGYIGAETKAAVDQLLADNQAAIGLIVAKATAYNEARAYDVTKEATVTAFENIIDDEKTTINNLIKAVPTYADYVALENEAAITTKLTADKAAIDFIVYKATQYDIINGNVKGATEAITNLAAITADEKTAFNALITAIPTYAEYIDVTTTTAVDQQLTSDLAKVSLILQQVQAYNSTRLYEKSAYDTYIATTLENVSDTEKTAIKAALAAVTVASDYLATENYETACVNLVTANKNTIDVIVYEAQKYDTILGDLDDYLTSISQLENLIVDVEHEIDEPAAFNDLLYAEVSYADYIVTPTTKPQTADAVTALKTATDNLYTADKNVLSLIVTKATAYNEARTYELEKEALVDVLVYVEDEDKNTINALLAAIPTYDDYVATTSATEISTLYQNNETAINLVYYKASKLDDSYDYAEDIKTLINGETIDTNTNLIGETDIATLEGLIDAVPAYNNYFDDTLTTNVMVNAVLTADQAALNLIKYQATKYNELLNYIADKKTEIDEYTDGDSAEKTLVYGLIDAIPVLANYTGKAETAVDTQLAADKAKVDLLEVRVKTYKDITTYIATSDTIVDAYTPENGEFKTVDKTAIKAIYAPYGDTDNYAAAVADFTTAQQFTAYYNTVKASIDLTAVTSATTFSNIINYVTTKINAINGNETISAEYKEAFINDIKNYKEYGTYSADVEEFTTAAQYTAYYNTVKAAVDNIISIVNKEVELINKKNSTLATLATKMTNGDITEAEKTYLGKVIEAIYEAYTNDEQIDLATVTTRVQTAKTEMDDVIAKTSKFTNVDAAIKTLNTDITNYISDAKKNFIRVFNQGEEYHDAQDVWDANEATIIAKGDETKYSYNLPTTYAYTDFTSFVNGLTEPTTITNRLKNILQAWYENEEDADEDGVFDGMLYQMTEEYLALEADTMEVARAKYLGELEAAYNEYRTYDGTDTTKPNYSSLFNTLRLIYNTSKSAVNSATSTAKVIEKYNNGIEALDDVVLDTCKQFYLAEFRAAVDDEIDANPSMEDVIEDLYDTWSGTINLQTTTADVLVKYNAAIQALSTIGE